MSSRPPARLALVSLCLVLAAVKTPRSARAAAANLPGPAAAPTPPPVLGPPAAPPPASTSAAPVNPLARARYDEGLALFGQKQYAAAIAAFDAGFALEPHRAFLFAKGQAQRLAGDCAHAIATYDAFLATAPPPQQVDATHLAIERCARAAALAPAAPATPPIAVLPSPRPTPSWRRAPALVSWAAAGASAGVGVWLYLASRSAGDEADRANRQSYPAFAAAWERHNSQLRAAEVAWLLGAAFLAGGVSYSVLAGKTNEAPAGGLAFSTSLEQTTVSFHARF